MSSSSSSETMNTARVTEFHKPYSVESIPVPTSSSIGANDVLVKIAVAGYCHTDAMVAEGVMGSKLPITGSHEGAGTVAAVGSDVTKFKVGDRIMVGLMTHLCGECRSCKQGADKEHYCPKQDDFPGITRDGCFADYVWVRGRRPPIPTWAACCVEVSTVLTHQRRPTHVRVKNCPMR